MKNREYKTLLALVLTLTLTAGALGVTPATVYAGEIKTTSVSADTAADTAAAPYKDETVYAKVDGSGAVTSVTVSDQLRNITDMKTIPDVSSLTHIENVKGDETFSQDNNNLTWTGANKNICYQGTSSQPLPVGVHISYTLDRKAITADELEGKSGHLVIRYEYQNTTASGSTYTPFLMITGLILDENVFTNVQLSGGKLISDGDRDVAVGMGLPGLKDSLGVTDLDIPDSFEVTADVTNYKAAEGITVATNELFNSVNTDKFDSLSDLEGAMDSLQSAADQLVDGSGQLKDGLDTLLSSSGTLTDGIDQLADGSSELKNGTDALLTGSNALAEGSRPLADGTAQLSYGVADMQEKTGSGVAALCNGTAALQAGVQKAAEAAAATDAGVDLAAAGADALSNGLEKAAVSASQLAGASGQLTQMLGQSVSGTTTVTVDNTALRARLQALADSMTNDADRAAVEAMLQEIPASQETTAATTTTLDPALAGTAQTITNGLSSLSTILGNNGEGTLGTGAKTLHSTLSSTEGETIKAGTAGLNYALNDKGENSLQGGIAQLQNGILSMGTQLDAGTSQLLDGLGSLQSGASTLSSGLSTLSAGAAQVNDGAGALNTEILTLQSGSGELVDGVKQLDDGAAKLNDGMIRFNEDGIHRLVSAFDGDIEGLLSNMNSLLDASRNYKNFSGISDHMDGEVKFIFITDK